MGWSTDVTSLNSSFLFKDISQELPSDISLQISPLFIPQLCSVIPWLLSCHVLSLVLCSLAPHYLRWHHLNTSPIVLCIFTLPKNDIILFPKLPWFLCYQPPHLMNHIHCQTTNAKLLKNDIVLFQKYLASCAIVRPLTPHYLRMTSSKYIALTLVYRHAINTQSYICIYYYYHCPETGDP